MADPVVFSCAHVLIGGYDISADLTSVNVNYGSESLDATAMGDGTRKHKGGLRMADLDVAGFVNLGSSLSDPALFGNVGVDNTVVSVFEHGITVGDTDGGRSMAGMQATYGFGGQVGSLLPFTAKAESAGRMGQSVVLWNALSTPWSTDSTGGTIIPISTGGWSSGEQLMAWAHITAVSTALGNDISIAIQQASSSGAGFTAAAVNRLTFNGYTCKAGVAATPITTHSTDQPFWRAMVTITSGTSTGASASGLIAVGMQ